MALKRLLLFLLCTVLVLLACFVAFYQSPAYLQEKPDPEVGLLKRPFLDNIHLPGQPNQLYPLKAKEAFSLKFKRPVLIRPIPLEKKEEMLAVVEQAGTIWLFENKPSPRKRIRFLDIKSKVSRRGNEEGLLGLAFHPKFKENGYFYVYYSTTGRRPSSIVSRFTATGSSRLKVSAKSEQLLMQIPQPYRNHNGGGIEFGPDGYLYIGLGDGGFANDPHDFGQNLSKLLGSILRIDVDKPSNGKNYGIPDDNPFIATQNAKKEIWAYGLRNPWRFSFDRVTGEMWTGDVGQNKLEEIDIIVKGGNYGWRIREGINPFAYSGFTPESHLIEPVFVYPRSEGVSITGGYVYRGKKFPELYGAYLYADYQSRKVWALWYDGNSVIKHLDLFVAPGPVASFGEDSAGEIYLCCFDGKIYDFEYSKKPNKNKKAFPTLLSETGLFEDVIKLTPNPGLIPYSINSPFWSDGAEKIRYFAVPNGEKINFSEEGSWSFPLGTIFVEHVEIELEEGNSETSYRLETRLLLNTSQGWEGYTYKWNTEQTEAKLLNAPEFLELSRKDKEGKPFQQKWYFPSRNDCTSCHTPVAGSILGLNTPQMNKSHRYKKGEFSQIKTFEHIGLFAYPVKKSMSELPQMANLKNKNVALEKRVMSYLATNCAFCHMSGGSGNANIDLRFGIPLAEKKMIDVTPTQGDLDVKGAKIIYSKEPEKSTLLLRMKRLDGFRMPNIASHKIDEEAVELLRQWILSLK